MTGIRELLDEATRDVVADPYEATERVRRGLRARRRANAAIVAIVAVVIAAIVVPVSLSGGSGESVTPGNHRPRHVPVLERWTNADGAVATGFGAIWALHICGTTDCQSWVDRLDPATGRQLARIDVPSPARTVAAYAGYIWVFGSSLASGRTSRVTVIDPVSHQVTGRASTDPNAAAHDIAFAAGSAWVTVPERNEVWRFTPGTGVGLGPPPGFQPARIHVPGNPSTIATTGSGQIWAQSQNSNTLTRIVPTETAGRVGQTVMWGSEVFSATSPPRTVLALGAGATVGTLEPSRLNSCLACAQGGGFFAKGTVNAVLQTDRGWWVATSQRTYFYNHKSFRSGGQPTASLSGQASSLAPDGRGVIVGNPIIGLFRWTPRGS